MAGKTFTIRPMVAGDLDEVLVIWRQMADDHAAYDPHRWHWARDAESHVRSRFAELMDRPEAVQLVAVGRSGQVIGFCSGGVRSLPPLFATQCVGEISDLAVAEDRRRHGVGTAILKAMLAELRRQGAEEVRLSVAIQNKAAAGLYRKLGLHEVSFSMSKRLDD
jgi:ribosomal protein S18 acetylase RimI-like enzyme